MATTIENLGDGTFRVTVTISNVTNAGDKVGTERLQALVQQSAPPSGEPKSLTTALSAISQALNNPKEDFQNERCIYVINFKPDTKDDDEVLAINYSIGAFFTRALMEANEVPDWRWPPLTLPPPAPVTAGVAAAYNHNFDFKAGAYAQAVSSTAASADALLMRAIYGYYDLL